MDIKASIGKQIAKYEALAEQLRANAHANDGAAQALRALLGEIEAEEAKENHAALHEPIPERVA